VAKKTKTAQKSKKNTPLTTKQKRVRDIGTMLESIRLDWLELSKTIDGESAKGIKKHLRWCQKHLEELQEELRSDKR
jgi:hypothetical protein